MKGGLFQEEGHKGNSMEKSSLWILHFSQGMGESLTCAAVVTILVHSEKLGLKKVLFQRNHTTPAFYRTKVCRTLFSRHRKVMRLTVHLTKINSMIEVSSSAWCIFPIHQIVSLWYGIEERSPGVFLSTSRL